MTPFIARSFYTLYCWPFFSPVKAKRWQVVNWQSVKNGLSFPTSSCTKQNRYYLCKKFMIFFTRRLLLLIFLQYKVLSFQTFTIFLQNTFLELCFKFVLCSLYGCPNVINVPLVFICDVHTAPLHAFRNSKLIILFKKFMINFVLG